MTLGAPASPCPLPVTFEAEPRWTAEAVDPAVGPVRQGPLTLRCEVNARPAGHVGFLRVWTGPAGGATPRETLAAFLAADHSAGRAHYTETRAGGLPAATVTYTVTSELLDAPKPERALAVTTPGGPVLLHLGGLDTTEHQALLPALARAERTLRLAGN